MKEETFCGQLISYTQYKSFVLFSGFGTCELHTQTKLSVSQPGWFTCVCLWIKVLKSPPHVRFEGCVCLLPNMVFTSPFLLPDYLYM